jgi:hypothetical protein
MKTYSIYRYYFGKPKELINTGFTLEQAQKHCNDPKTKGDGWFDGYTVEEEETDEDSD